MALVASSVAVDLFPVIDESASNGLPLKLAKATTVDPGLAAALMGLMFVVLVTGFRGEDGQCGHSSIDDLHEDRDRLEEPC